MTSDTWCFLFMTSWTLVMVTGGGGGGGGVISSTSFELVWLAVSV